MVRCVCTQTTAGPSKEPPVANRKPGGDSRKPSKHGDHDSPKAGHVKGNDFTQFSS